MSVRGRVIGAVTVGAVGLAAAGAGVGVNRQRKRIARRAPDDVPAFGSLHSAPITVVAADGTPLHVEVDEPELPAKGRSRKAKPPLTVIFAHGYALELDCWHFQREHFRSARGRGQVRTVFYDQRSHGRSGRSPLGNATIEQLGSDLLAVMDAVAPEGPVVVVGHSMGGMTVVALAEQHPELFGDRVVGTALISTTAGGLEPSRILFPMVPAWGSAGPVGRTISTLARTHRIVDGVRKVGRDVALVATANLAFGDDVPGSYVEFVDRMLSATPFEVVAEFFPGFSSLDKFDAVEVLAKVPTVVICGTEDKLTSIGHSRKLQARIDGSTLLECHGAGHMVILERHSEVNGELDRLLAATGAEDAR
ncbi:alpha/beta hydrolase [Nocardioides sp. Root1257]|uniref:alpha/beta fold hydrolase n=1 Tax=unclassified Nocardioides TaxID=2615069 RepID=UPI0006FD5BFA|nr:MULTISPECIES: alpha/beta hydrolase [unclassified Nocardioides]KQW48811.1 alpha/beta hydrolase [Nocardioides sp. Root1257]KRC47986.1 alpha/beta hydrolase [Nocardioides sp. Root224]